MTTRNQKEAKDRLTLLERHYQLRVLPHKAPQKWPEKHVTLFRNMCNLGETKFVEWEATLRDDCEMSPWKVATRQQVERVVQKAKECMVENRNEFEWRMALEPLLFDKFNHGATW